MALNASEAATVVAARLAAVKTERVRLDRIDAYLRGAHAKPYQPKNPNDEYRLLESRAVSNWLPLIIDAPAQALYVEGYRRSDDEDNAEAWGAWQANGLDHRQTAVIRAALGFGTAYVTVLPGEPVPVIRGVSPRKMLAFYEDPAEDDWPVYAIRLDRRGDGYRVRLYDEAAVYELEVESLDDESPVFRGGAEHGLGVCPVVRFTSGLDLDGRARGTIEPLIPVQDRINQTTFDLLLAQTYGAVKIRTVSGMELPAIDEDATPEAQAQQRANRRARQVELSVDRMLVAEDENTKFGSLDETPLGGFIESLDASVRHLAAISQTPPSYLLGQMANLSAEALASAEAGLTRKVEEQKHGLGESWEQTLRLTDRAAGGDGEDYSAQVVWRDSEARSLAATVDALGKATSLLGIPAQALWERIPGVTQTDVLRWKALAAEADPLAALVSNLEPVQPPAPRA